MSRGAAQHRQPASAAWDDDRVVKLKEMLLTGLSAGELGRALGVTRSAVIGKVARLGLKLPGSTLGAPKAPPVKRDPYGQNGYNCGKSSIGKKAQAQSSKRGGGINFRRADGASGIEAGRSVCDLPVEIAPNAKSLLDLAPDDCRWIVSGAGEMALFCCRPKWGRSYCEAHHRNGVQGGGVTRPAKDWLDRKAANPNPTKENAG